MRTAAATALGYARAVRRIVATFAPTAAQQRNQGPGFAAEGAFALVGDITWRQFLRSCISENNRYLSSFDPRLLRPRVLPTLARLARLIDREYFELAQLTDRDKDSGVLYREISHFRKVTRDWEDR